MRCRTTRVFLALLDDVVPNGSLRTGTAGNGDLNVDKEDMVAVRRGNEQEETRADKAEQVGLYQGRHPKRNARRGVRCATRRPALRDLV